METKLPTASDILKGLKNQTEIEYHSLKLVATIHVHTVRTGTGGVGGEKGHIPENRYRNGGMFQEHPPSSPLRHIKVSYPIVIYNYLQLSTCVYSCLQVSTIIYNYLQLSTCVYKCLQVSTIIYKCLHV